MAEEPDHRRATLERDIVAWERRALKAERERDQAIQQERERLRATLAKVPSTGGVVTVVDLETALDALDLQGESDG